MKFTRESPKKPCVSQCAQGSWVFLEAGLAKWGRLKRIRTLEWLSDGNKQKKARRGTVCGQLCMYNISNGLNESDDSSASLLLLSSSQILHNLSLLLTRSFCPLDKIAIASSARPSFASSLRDVFSFVLRCFCFFKLVHVYL